MIAFCTTYSIAALVATALSCRPTAFFWDKSFQGGHCFNLLAFWFANAAICIFTDIALCVLPLPVLWKLRLPRRQKYSVLLVFLLGGFGCVTAILRLHSIDVIGRSVDPTYDNAGAAMWSSIELNTCIICGSLPTLRRLINRVWPKFLQSTLRTPHLDEVTPYRNRGASKDIESTSTAVQPSEDEVPLHKLSIGAEGGDSSVADPKMGSVSVVSREELYQNSCLVTGDEHTAQ